MRDPGEDNHVLKRRFSGIPGRSPSATRRILPQEESLRPFPGPGGSRLDKIVFENYFLSNNDVRSFPPSPGGLSDESESENSADRGRSLHL